MIYDPDMANSFKPWEHYPSMTARRLAAVASLLQRTRDTIVEISEPEQGDSSWSIGCRVYDRTIFKLREASIGCDWLRVLPETQRLRLTFTIGSVPLKLYKGEPDDLPSKTLVRSFSELRQMRLAFEHDGIDVSLSIRIAVEADADGRTTAISLVEVDGRGEPRRVYDIPLNETNVVAFKPAPIELPAPRLRRIEPETKEQEVADDLNASGTGNKP
jgi:hypothetical protein